MSPDKAQLQRAASVEAEVARARLARASMQGERGDVLGAVDQAAEAAFDAGLVYGYALGAGDQNFQEESRRILESAQDLLRNWVLISERRAVNPARTAADREKQAAAAAGDGAFLEAVYLTGTAYAETGNGDVLEVYTDSWGALRSLCFAHSPRPVRKLRTKLLR